MTLELDPAAPCVAAFAPGRTEIAGNHTDHQGGRVIAASVDCGIRMRVQAVPGTRARIASEGFPAVELDLTALSPAPALRGTTAGLAAGVVAGLRAAGVDVQGFDLIAQSTVPAGGGLSSSAAFELALARALACLFAGDKLDAVLLARIGQAAERDWFGKPCGLMDQLAIARGGLSLIDFSGQDVAAQPFEFDFEQAGYTLFLVDVHCDHSAYICEYAQVAQDMFDVAAYLGKNALSEVDEEAFMAKLEDVRAKLGDLCALRALHYYHEMELVDARARALAAGDVAAFMAAQRRSGASSAQFLQNVSTSDRARQPAMVALALCERMAGAQGAVRIHGGGFGGTVQAFVPHVRARAFADGVDAHLGAGSARAYRITAEGAHAQWIR